MRSKGVLLLLTRDEYAAALLIFSLAADTYAYIGGSKLYLPAFPRALGRSAVHSLLHLAYNGAGSEARWDVAPTRHHNKLKNLDQHKNCHPIPFTLRRGLFFPPPALPPK